MKMVIREHDQCKKKKKQLVHAAHSLRGLAFTRLLKIN